MTTLAVIPDAPTLPRCRWRGPQLATGNYPCASTKVFTRGGGGVPAAACLGCSLADHPPPAGGAIRLAASPIATPARFKLNCAHRGPQTRTLGKGCGSCRVFACAKHGECMIAPHLDRGGIPLCSQCADYEHKTQTAGPPPNVLDHGAGGLGDGLLGLCAVAGLKADHSDWTITYRPGAAAIEVVRQFHGYDVLALRQSPTHDGPMAGAVQLNAGYREEFRDRFAVPRWERYRKNAGASRCAIPGLRDTRAIFEGAADLAGRAILAPFSTEPAREWSVQHYLTLGRLLTEAGYKVAVVHTDVRKLSPFRGAERWHDLTPERLTGACLGAVAVIGPDSGPAHLGGILGTPTVVLGGYTPVRQIFGFYPRVTCLQGPLDCSGCCSQWPIDRRCRSSCAAIQAIRPEEVLAAIRKAVGGA
jgi:hypothetical protein